MTRSCIPFLLLLIGLLATILYTDRKARTLEKETLVIAISAEPEEGNPGNNPGLASRNTPLIDQ